jgi:hypothetical protein
LLVAGEGDGRQSTEIQRKETGRGNLRGGGAKKPLSKSRNAGILTVRNNAARPVWGRGARREP